MAKMNNQEQSIFEKREENLKKRAFYWRKNPHRFIEEYLGIHLHFYQKVIIYLMNLSPHFVFIASRGNGKTFLIALFALYRCILYPGTKVLLSAENMVQSSSIVSEKIFDIYNKSEALRIEIGNKKNLNTAKMTANVKFMNGSKIITTVSTQGGRGGRAQVLVVDEFARVKKDIYDDVLSPTANNIRIPRFKEKYPQKYKHYVEKNIQILMTSATNKSNWSWNEFKITLERMMTEGVTEALTVAIPYQVSVLHGLQQQEDIDRRLDDNSYDRYSFMMEYESIFVGESENAYYTFDLLDKNRSIKKAFMPPTLREFNDNRNLAHPKKLTNIPLVKDEIRLVSLDVATIGGNQNDTSAITCLRMIPTGDGEYIKQVAYIETLNDRHLADDIAIRLKQLFNDFEATYAVLDTGGLGIYVYDELAQVLQDDERGIEYEPWKSINNQVHASRVNIANAKPVLFTVSATDVFNNDMIIQLHNDLSSGRLKLLIHDTDKTNELRENEGAKWMLKDIDEQNRILYPYYQTTSLVNEMISLSYKYVRNGNVSVEKPRNGTKDRFSSLGYAVYFANYIEKNNKKKANQTDLQAANFAFKWKETSGRRELRSGRKRKWG